MTMCQAQVLWGTMSWVLVFFFFGGGTRPSDQPIQTIRLQGPPPPPATKRQAIFTYKDMLS